MKTKTIPFDLETAKKIQAGEIEGRIVTNHDMVVTLVDAQYGFDEEYWIPIIWHWAKEHNELVLYNSKGECKNSHNNCYLHIELPEESPKRKVKLADTINRIASTFSTEREGEAFKQGIIYAVSVDAEYKDQLGMYGKGGEETPNPLEKVLNKIKDSKWDGYFESKKEDCGQCFEDALVKETSKHEFKPFDKVLVRMDGKDWTAAIYSHYDNKIKHNYHYVANGAHWEECILYAGNEHLVGTTDKPKEE